MTEINGSDRLKFGAYEADLHTHELWKHGTRIKLVGQPFDILAVLISRPGQLVTREELREELWPGDTFVDFNHGLNAAVNKLRDALCDSAEDPKYIETLPRRGYRFIATVERAVSDEVPVKNLSLAEGEETKVLTIDLPSGLSAAQPQAIAEPAKLEKSVRHSTTKPLRYLIPAVLVVAGIAWLVISNLHPSGEQEEKLLAEKNRVRAPMLLTGLSDPTSDPAFSADGNRIAFRRNGFVPGTSGIWVKQIGTEELTQITSSETGDCCPVWSPDGHALAFSRFSDSERTIYRVSEKGGSPERLYSAALTSKHGELDWSPDGNIALVGDVAGGGSAIFLLSTQDGTTRRLTSPTPPDSDWGPTFSPDGTQIAFLRANEGRFPASIMLMSAEGGEVRRLTTDPQQVDGLPAWSADGSALIFAARESDADRLWRVPVTRGIPTQIAEVGSPAWSPAISKRGFRLAYLRLSNSRSIEQIDLHAARQNARGLITSVGGQNAGPQISPDGKRLAFMSDRSGAMDIWVSERNGENPVQLTAVGTAGTPRWSPDGKTIAFDVGLGPDWRQPRAIFLVNADGGVPRALVQDAFNNPVPSWSRDGAWIYFASDRSGAWQVWKIPATGGTPVQVTTQGGFAAWEAADHYLYYSKHRDENPELWRVPVGGGTEGPVFPRVQPEDWGAWATVDKGIFFVGTGPQPVPTLSFFDFTSLTIRPITIFSEPPFWLGAPADGTSVVFDLPGSEASHVMVLDNFH